MAKMSAAIYVNPHDVLVLQYYHIPTFVNLSISSLGSCSDKQSSVIISLQRFTAQYRTLILTVTYLNTKCLPRPQHRPSMDEMATWTIRWLADGQVPTQVDPVAHGVLHFKIDLVTGVASFSRQQKAMAVHATDQP